MVRVPTTRELVKMTTEVDTAGVEYFEFMEAINEVCAALSLMMPRSMCLIVLDVGLWERVSVMCVSFSGECK
jgi:hypothetical protein